MAGIGFNLQKILEGDTYIDSLKAHFYSALITSGPWIMSILTIFILNLLAPAHLSRYDMLFFRTAITYSYAFSLIIVGILQLALTRHLADKLYLKEKEALVPMFNSGVILVLITQSIVGLIFILTNPESLPVKLAAVFIFLAISLIWVVMIFLTALWDYKSIAISFFVGCVVTIGASWLLGSLFGLVGYLIGYAIGHLLIVMMLSARIFIEFSSSLSFDFTLHTFFKNNMLLVLIGLVYNLAIWIDKIVFWGSPLSDPISGVFKTFPNYETAVFLAYLTIIPALTLFLIQIETNFYKKYRGFYQAILNKGSYTLIKKRKHDIIKTLSYSIMYVVKYQGLVSLFFIVFAPQIAEFARMPATAMPIFRITVLGAFLHSILMIFLIVALYFDFRGVALQMSVVFLLGNGLFTYATTKMPEAYFGYGYLVAAFVSVVFAYFCLDYKIKRLEYITFASQPVGIHREKEIF